MNRPTSRTLTLSALGLATALLVACGGGDAPDQATGTEASSIQVAQTDTAVRVLSSSDDSGKASSEPATIVSQKQYTFSAQIERGEHTGRRLSGTLLLRSVSEGDTTRLEGSLVPAAALPRRRPPPTRRPRRTRCAQS